MRITKDMVDAAVQDYWDSHPMERNTKCPECCALGDAMYESDKFQQIMGGLAAHFGIVVDSDEFVDVLMVAKQSLLIGMRIERERRKEEN